MKSKVKADHYRNMLKNYVKQKIDVEDQKKDKKGSKNKSQRYSFQKLGKSSMNSSKNYSKKHQKGTSKLESFSTKNMSRKKLKDPEPVKPNLVERLNQRKHKRRRTNSFGKPGFNQIIQKFKKSKNKSISREDPNNTNSHKEIDHVGRNTQSTTLENAIPAHPPRLTGVVPLGACTTSEAVSTRSKQSSLSFLRLQTTGKYSEAKTESINEYLKEVKKKLKSGAEEFKQRKSNLKMRNNPRINTILSECKNKSLKKLSMYRKKRANNSKSNHQQSKTGASTSFRKALDTGLPALKSIHYDPKPMMKPSTGGSSRHSSDRKINSPCNYSNVLKENSHGVLQKAFFKKSRKELKSKGKFDRERLPDPGYKSFKSSKLKNRHGGLVKGGSEKFVKDLKKKKKKKNHNFFRAVAKGKGDGGPNRSQNQRQRHTKGALKEVKDRENQKTAGTLNLQKKRLLYKKQRSNRSSVKFRSQGCTTLYNKVKKRAQEKYDASVGHKSKENKPSKLPSPKKPRKEKISSRTIYTSQDLRNDMHRSKDRNTNCFSTDRKSDLNSRSNYSTLRQIIKRNRIQTEPNKYTEPKDYSSSFETTPLEKPLSKKSFKSYLETQAQNKLKTASYTKLRETNSIKRQKAAKKTSITVADARKAGIPKKKEKVLQKRNQQQSSLSKSGISSKSKKSDQDNLISPLYTKNRRFKQEDYSPVTASFKEKQMLKKALKRQMIASELRSTKNGSYKKLKNFKTEDSLNSRIHNYSIKRRRREACGYGGAVVKKSFGTLLGLKKGPKTASGGIISDQKVRVLKTEAEKKILVPLLDSSKKQTFFDSDQKIDDLRLDGVSPYSSLYNSGSVNAKGAQNSARSEKLRDYDENDCRRLDFDLSSSRKFSSTQRYRNENSDGIILNEIKIEIKPVESSQKNSEKNLGQSRSEEWKNVTVTLFSDEDDLKASRRNPSAAQNSPKGPSALTKNIPDFELSGSNQTENSHKNSHNRASMSANNPRNEMIKVEENFDFQKSRIEKVTKMVVSEFHENPSIPSENCSVKLEPEEDDEECPELGWSHTRSKTRLGEAMSPSNITNNNTVIDMDSVRPQLDEEQLKFEEILRQKMLNKRKKKNQKIENLENIRLNQQPAANDKINFITKRSGAQHQASREACSGSHVYMELSEELQTSDQILSSKNREETFEDETQEIESSMTSFPVSSLRRNYRYDVKDVTTDSQEQNLKAVISLGGATNHHDTVIVGAGRATYGSKASKGCPSLLKVEDCVLSDDEAHRRIRIYEDMIAEKIKETLVEDFKNLGGFGEGSEGREDYGDDYAVQ